SLSRLMIYILGHRPDEFGLVPDEDGSVTYKQLLRAIHEEPGWSYVRQGHINEVLIGKDRSLFQWEEDRIKVLERRWQLDPENPALSLPKVLYIAVRRRAHAHVMEKGLISETYLVLSPVQDMAMRIGRRRDPKPVLLEVITAPALEQGVSFYPFGELFLTHEIPAGLISGPPVPKEAREARASGEAKKEKAKQKQPDLSAGTFTLDAQRDTDLQRRSKGKKRRGWKEEARKLRRRKRR
ncbi:MAG: hypothetical protein PVG99_14695, partial [Desulfobacteraceae bacterium]